MDPFLYDEDFTLYCGDAREVLAHLPDRSVHCALTSPPFYALRDYGVDGQIGLEKTPEEWVDKLVAVFREIRRVLRDDGTLWVECGDSYSASPPGNKGAPDEAYRSSGLAGARAGSRYMQTLANSVGQKRDTSRIAGLKPKDLLGQPWMLAFALRADGWYLRQCIIWHKQNAMPESVTDRCTTAHSYIFLLSKSARYFYDADAISEAAEWARWGDQTTPKYEGTQTKNGWMQPRTKAELRERSRRGDWQSGGLDAGKSTWPDGRQTGFTISDQEPPQEETLIASGGRTTNGKRERSEEMRGFDNRLDRADGRKNARSVWTIPTQGYADAHFATWPERLAERIMLAATSEKGCCPECAAPWERVTVEQGYTKHRPSAGDDPRSRSEDKKALGSLGGHHGWKGNNLLKNAPLTKGWRPTCQHYDELYHRDFPKPSGRWQQMTWWDRVRRRPIPDRFGWPVVPAVVMDPFLGSGTTAFVARRLGRHSLGIELNEKYCGLILERTKQLSLLA